MWICGASPLRAMPLQRRTRSTASNGDAPGGAAARMDAPRPAVAGRRPPRRGRDAGRKRHERLVAAHAMRPHAGTVMRAAWRT